jgi:hypothetical protein
MNFINPIKHQVKFAFPIVCCIAQLNSRQADEAPQALLHFVSGISSRGVGLMLRRSAVHTLLSGL